MEPAPLLESPGAEAGGLGSAAPSSCTPPPRVGGAPDRGEIPIGQVPPPEEKERKLKQGIDPEILRLQTMDYSCPICYEVMEKPVKTPCNHIFCLRCCQEMSEKPKFNCPICTRDLKSFKPKHIDMQLRKHFLDLNAKRVAAGLATPDSRISLKDDVPPVSYQEAMAALVQHQRDHALRPLPRMVILHVRTSIVSCYRMQAFVEKRHTVWKEGEIGNSTATEVRDKEKSALTTYTHGAEAVWGIVMEPDKYFKKSVLERSMPGTIVTVELKNKKTAQITIAKSEGNDCGSGSGSGAETVDENAKNANQNQNAKNANQNAKNAKNAKNANRKGPKAGHAEKEKSNDSNRLQTKHIQVRAEFDILESKRIQVKDTGLYLPDSRITELELGLRDRDAARMHRTPGGALAGSGRGTRSDTLDDPAIVSSTCNWHTLPPGNARLEAIKDMSDAGLRSCIESCIDEQNLRTKKNMMRIVARRQGISYYRIAEVRCEYGRGAARAPFTFNMLQNVVDFSKQSHLADILPPGGAAAATPLPPTPTPPQHHLGCSHANVNQHTVLWYKRYPDSPQCCVII